MAIEPSHSHVLTPQEPIPHRTRLRSAAPTLALFAGCRPYHESVINNIPTIKSTCAPPTQLGFAGLCKAVSMSPNKVDGFANLCSSLEKLDHFDPSALLVLDPATGESLEHCQLRCGPRYKATWDTSYANELGRLCQGIRTSSTPTSQQVAGINTFFLIDYQDILTHKRKKSATPWSSQPEKDDPDQTGKPLAATGSAIQEMSAPTRPRSNLSSYSSTVSSPGRVHGSAPST